MGHIVDLPQAEWHKCTWCNGTGERLEHGDAHHSSGIVPCTRCSGGVFKVRVVTTEEYEALKKDQIIKPPVHVDDLFTAVMEFHSAVRRSISNGQYSQKPFDEARDKFKTFCVEHGLNIDSTER